MWVWNKNFPLKKPLKCEYSNSIIWVLAGTLLTFKKNALLTIMCNFSNHHFEEWFASSSKQNIFGKINCYFFITRGVNKILKAARQFLSLVTCIVTRCPFGEKRLGMDGVWVGNMWRWWWYREVSFYQLV